MGVICLIVLVALYAGAVFANFFSVYAYDNETGVKKISRKRKNHKHKIKNSFLIIDGKAYAVAYKEYIGKGRYGVVKIIRSEDGSEFAIKRELMEDTTVSQLKSDKDTEIEQKILEKLGQLKSVFYKQKGNDVYKFTIQEYHPEPQPSW